MCTQMLSRVVEQTHDGLTIVVGRSTINAPASALLSTLIAAFSLRGSAKWEVVILRLAGDFVGRGLSRAMVDTVFTLMSHWFGT
jgi:hypothetical protein